MLGHNKCIFKQYQFTNKFWVGNDKICSILPKDEGAGVMVSTLFQSHKFVFGKEMTSEQLGTFNNKEEDECYMNKDTVKLNKGKKEKDKLTLSSFYVEFKYIAQNQGY